MRAVTWFALTALLLSGCGRSVPGSAGGEGPDGGTARQSGGSAAQQLIIISPHNEYIRYEFGHAFERWYEERTGTAVTVDWRDLGGTSDDVKFIRSSFAKVGEQAGIGADIFFGGGIPPYVRLAEEGLFTPYRLPEELLARIPETFPGGRVYDQQFRYYGTVFSGFGIMYNREVLRRLGLAEPRGWEDLAQPGAFTWVGMGDPRSSGSALMVFQIILQAFGWERGWDIITRMGGNVRYFTRSSSAIPKDIALGEIAYGGAIDFYATTAIERAGGDRLGFVLPQGKTVMNPDPIAILRGPPHPELARAFVRFVMGEEGQRLWFLPAGSPGGPERYRLRRLPVLPEVYPRYARLVGDLRSPYDWKTDFVYDGAQASRLRSVLEDLLGAFIIDTQYELVPAWKALIEAGLPPEALRELTRIPIGEEEALALGQWWGKVDHVESRIVKLTEFSALAVRKYRRARALAQAHAGSTLLRPERYWPPSASPRWAASRAATTATP